MAAAMIKDGETASGPPLGSPGPRQIILAMTQTGTVVFFKRFLFNCANHFFAEWQLLHVLEVWKPFFLFFFKVFVLGPKIAN